VSGTFGTAPRTLDGVYSPWRNSTDVAVNKDFPLRGRHRAAVRVEVINLFDNPWYVALASTAHGNADFGRVTAQANYSRTVQLAAPRVGSRSPALRAVWIERGIGYTSTTNSDVLA
jgi:hypothetical protein